MSANGEAADSKIRHSIAISHGVSLDEGDARHGARYVGTFWESQRARRAGLVATPNRVGLCQRSFKDGSGGSLAANNGDHDALALEQVAGRSRSRRRRDASVSARGESVMDFDQRGCLVELHIAEVGTTVLEQAVDPSLVGPLETTARLSSSRTEQKASGSFFVLDGIAGPAARFVCIGQDGALLVALMDCVRAFQMTRSLECRALGRVSTVLRASKISC
jgi:hypothetical protein